jgi:hypothetical protein
MPTTNERVRRRYEAGGLLNDGAPKNTVIDDPANGAETAVGEDTDVHVVNPDGTNAVSLDAAAEAGREIKIVHNGGASTPTLSFDDADFVGTGPADLTTPGETATVLNTNGETSGWVVVATGSA